MLDKPAHRVHLFTGSPWRQVFDYCWAPEKRSLAALPDFKGPHEYDAEDIAIWIVDARERAIIAIETLPDSSEYYTAEMQQTDREFVTGISVRAVELRIGESLPDGPATIDLAFGQRVIDAIHAEEHSPTPWQIVDTTGCAAGFPQLSVASARVRLSSPWICECCDRDFSDVPYRLGLASVEWHKAEGGWRERGGGHEMIRVCASCHAMLHTPLAPSPEELFYFFRPQCPNCEEFHAVKLMYGMPAEAPPRGTTLRGCDLQPVAGALPEYKCGVCGHEW